MSIRVFLVAGVLLRYLGVLRMLIMGMPSTAGVRWRWGARVGPCRGATSYYGPVSSLHAQAAMLMTPRAVHSLPLRSARFDPIILPSFSLSLFHSLSLSLSFFHTHSHTLSPSFPRSLALSLSLFLSVSRFPSLLLFFFFFFFSLSTTNHGIAPPFLSPLVSFSWLKREDTMARRRLTSPTDFARPRTRFWPLRSKRARPTLTPSTSAIEREPGEIFERYTARRG